MRAEEVADLMNFHARKGVEFLFAMDFELQEALFIPRPTESKEVLFDIKGRGNAGRLPLRRYKEQGDVLKPLFCDKKQYERGFDTVRHGLMRGDSFLCNLTTVTDVDLSVDLEALFHISSAAYKLYVPERFVCFSPECFVRSLEGRLYTYPMKGTIDANVENAEECLLSDEKELREHFTIVDLMRNDLNSVCRDVRVEKFRYVERIDSAKGAVLQTSSIISARLPEDWLSRCGSMILSLLPAGSISGAPKKATVDLIRRAEGRKRGFYSGVFGFFDGKELDSAVMIRFVEKADGKYRFRSGGGITTNSECDKEYNEVLQKVYVPIKA